ncbi:serine/threonine protein kinase [Sinosporangium album]|uniref:non-specific serine/threonine protein kinase n=1 Tax=Sinosporangium album TaxID=504805 RepID=A0A1G7RTP1_9ACTN|nr:serine/threonine-protein kinase [Sinosporangium album]SDG14125.1 serine/threonine protein kinase [Sinosporangium album]
MGSWSVPGYHDVRQLGDGPSGRVYLSTHIATGAHVAIRYLNAALRKDEGLLAGFREATATLVELDESRVIRTYEYVETATRAALVMELVDGVPLGAMLTRHGATSPEAALAILKGSLLGLAAAHERGLVHGDHRSANVLVQADGLSRIGDFGLAAPRLAAGDGERPERTPRRGDPAYAAPELWAGEQPTVRTDLYAATCVFYECLTGQTPYSGRRPDGEVPLDDVPPAVRSLVLRGLAVEPDGRPASAREFLQELGAAAVAAQGPDWEKRGRRRLAEMATAMAMDFPLARPFPRRRTRTGRLSGRAGRIRPRAYGVVAATAVAAVVTTFLLLADLVGIDPEREAFLAPPPREPKAQAAPLSDPGPGPDATPPPTGAGRAPTGLAPSPLVTREPARPSVPPSPARVTNARIAAWDGADGTMRVRTAGRGPVRLSMMFTRRDGGGAVRTMHTESVVLSGRTVYSVPATHDFGHVACGAHAYFGVVLMTDRAAANGPQVAEVLVKGPSCARQRPPTVRPRRPGPPSEPDSPRSPEPSTEPASPSEPDEPDEQADYPESGSSD